MNSEMPTACQVRLVDAENAASGLKKIAAAKSERDEKFFMTVEDTKAEHTWDSIQNTNNGTGWQAFYFRQSEFELNPPDFDHQNAQEFSAKGSFKNFKFPLDGARSTCLSPPPSELLWALRFLSRPAGPQHYAVRGWPVLPQNPQSL
jgi:hypothetical protein